MNLPDRPQQSDAVARWQKSLKHAGGTSFTNAGDGSRQPMVRIDTTLLVDDPNSECEIEGLRCFDGLVLDPQDRLRQDTHVTRAVFEWQNESYEHF